MERNLHFIVDVKEFNVKDKLVQNYGWSVFPIYEQLDIDDNDQTEELFYNSGFVNLPLFKGDVIDWIVEELPKQPNLYAFLDQLLDDPESGLVLYDPKSVIIRCVDN